ncbi:hypothetical protein ADICYQ_5480 [Cyclobacterium qasimii M12-11B]|nr:hypothetical protein ADICYQ_5480 [Cyclobacterium qasimii M12-11B]
MVVLHDRTAEGIFQFYSNKGFKKTFSFGKFGEGPEEFGSMPDIIPSSIKNYGKDGFGFTVHDVNKRVIKEYSLKDIFQNNDVPKETYRVNEKILGGFELSFLPNNTIIGKDHINGEGNFFIFNEDSQTKHWTNYFPDLPDVNFNTKKPIAYDSFLSINEEVGVIVQSMKYFNRLNFYDLEGVFRNSILIGDEVMPDFSTDTNLLIPGGVITFTVDMFLSDNFIYLLYANVETGKMFQEEADENNSFKVLQFDFEGQLINEFNLDRQLFSFVIDDQENLMGLSFEEGVIRLIKYSL